MMKKKFFAVALATTMTVSTVMTASAETISGAWWTSWSQGYEVADGETVEFDMELKGGDAVWNNVSAVFVNGKTTGTTAPADEVAGYKEYAVVRGDNWGWGGGDNKTVDGNDISYQGGVADLGEADFIATMKDAHLEVSVTREGNDIEYTYTAIGANGIETTRTVNFTSDLSEGCYVFFVSDSSTVDISLVEEDSSEDPTDDTKKDDTTEATTKKDDATKETTTKKEESTTKKEESTTASSSVKAEATATDAAKAGATVTGTNVPTGATVTVNTVTDKDTLAKVDKAVKDTLSSKVGKYAVLDITMSDAAGAKIQPLNNGNVLVTIDVPSTLDANKGLVVYRMEDNGTLTELKTSVENGKVSFETNHFSTYIVAEKAAVAEETTTAAAAKETTTAKTNSPKTGDAAPVAALMVVALGACGAVIASKKKNA